MSFDELIRQSDIITLHVPGNAENTHLIDSVAFEKMKDGVIIVNTARGLIIDTQALIQSLKTERSALPHLIPLKAKQGCIILTRRAKSWIMITWLC